MATTKVRGELVDLNESTSESGLKIPSGTELNRPTAATGQIRNNTNETSESSASCEEYYNGSAWQKINNVALPPEKLFKLLNWTGTAAEKAVTGFGNKPDLVIIDYVDLLGTKKKTADRKGEIDDIYQSTKGLARQLDIPIWSVSQVNRAGAKDDIVEGDKAAGSYDKIMITDFCMSLSRKKQDKVNGTGRFHIMKNRYGMDGLTYGVKADR